MHDGSAAAPGSEFAYEGDPSACKARRNLLRGLKPGGGLRAGGRAPGAHCTNDVGNKYSPTVIAAAITSQHDKSRLPTHIEVNAGSCGLARDSVVLLEQVRTIDKRRLKERMGALDGQDMGKVDHAISVSFGL